MNYRKDKRSNAEFENNIHTFTIIENLVKPAVLKSLPPNTTINDFGVDNSGSIIPDQQFYTIKEKGNFDWEVVTPNIPSTKSAEDNIPSFSEDNIPSFSKNGEDNIPSTKSIIVDCQVHTIYCKCLTLKESKLVKARDKGWEIWIVDEYGFLKLSSTACSKLLECHPPEKQSSLGYKMGTRFNADSVNQLIQSNCAQYIQYSQESLNYLQTVLEICPLTKSHIPKTILEICFPKHYGEIPRKYIIKL